jgi:uncharacterized membrane protein YfcA
MIIICLIGFLSGFIGALGLGGGGVLVMFLTVFLGIGQLKAQGINLLFFIPVGIFAIIFHCKKKLINWKIALPAIISGLIGAALGCFLANFLGAAILRKIFGAMLLLLGGWELFAPHKKKDGNVQKAK